MDLEWNSKTCHHDTLTEAWRSCYLMLMKLLVVRCILSASSSNSFTPSYRLRWLPKTETNHAAWCFGQDSIYTAGDVLHISREREVRKMTLSSADLWLVTIYPYSSFPPEPSTSGSPCSFKPCPASAGAACVDWEAEGGRVLDGAVAGTEVEDWAGGASWGPGTGVGFSGLRETLSVFNSCTCWGNDKGAVRDSERMAASCEHCWQWMLTYLLEGDGVFLSWICVERDRVTFSNERYSKPFPFQ